MQGIVETITTLKGRFGDDGDALKIIEREAELAQKWIAEAEPPEPKVSPRQFGAVEPSEGQHGTRSVFDDIDEGEA
jgi:hypothetical protein